MFNKQYGFRENPFSEKHNIDYFYLNNSNKQLYRNLLSDIYQRVDLTLLLADWGVGKTAFLQQLIGIDPYQIKVIYFHDTGQWYGLVDYLCNELGLAIDGHDTQGKEQLLAEYLTEINQQGIIPVLIVDNTQELEDDSLVPLLRLSRQRIEGQPLIQVILAAVPAFMAHFDFPVLQPYKSSISRQYQLKALSLIEVKEYIYFRLRQAGCEREDLFSDSAVQAIFDRSGGIPQLINKLCSSALLFASLDGYQVLDEKVIDEASKHCLLRPDTVEIDEVDDTYAIKSLSDVVKPDFPHAPRDNGGEAGPDANTNTGKIPINLWSSQLVRYGGTAAVALTVLLTGITLLLLKTNPEQKLKEKTDINLPVMQSNNVNERVNTKLFVDEQQHQKKEHTLEIRTIKKQNVVARNNRSETSTPKGIHPKADVSATEDKGRLVGNGVLATSSAVRKQQLPDTKPPPRPEISTKNIDTTQETILPGNSEKNSSRKHQAGSKELTIQNKRASSSEPTNLDRRERQAKNRALARLQLKESSIEFGVDALMTAADTADNNALELLLAGGIPPDIQEQTISLTALALAAANGHRDTVQLLLSHDAAIDTRNFKGRTALMAAAGNGHSDTVRVLLNSGAQINITDSDGWTALMFAAYSNHLEATQVLLERGAEHRLKNSVGRTALQIARNRGYQGIMELVAERMGINTH